LITPLKSGAACAIGLHTPDEAVPRGERRFLLKRINTTTHVDVRTRKSGELHLHLYLIGGRIGQVLFHHGDFGFVAKLGDQGFFDIGILLTLSLAPIKAESWSAGKIQSQEAVSNESNQPDYGFRREPVQKVVGRSYSFCHRILHSLVQMPQRCQSPEDHQPQPVTFRQGLIFAHGTVNPTNILKTKLGRSTRVIAI
jgi:hypothetical protein